MSDDVKYPYFDKLEEGINYESPVLLNCLKERGLASTRIALYNAERKQSIPQPRRHGTSKRRLYYKSEIEIIIRKLEGRNGKA